MNQPNPVYVQKGREYLQALPIPDRVVLAFATLHALELNSKLLVAGQEMFGALMKDDIPPFLYHEQVLAEIGQHLAKYPGMPLETVHSNITLALE